MKNLTDMQLLELYKSNREAEEQAVKEAAAQQERERNAYDKTRLDAYLESNKLVSRSAKYSKLRTSIKTELLEAALNTIFDDCFGNTSFDNSAEDNAFNQTIISNFVSDEGPDNLLDGFSERTEFLSALAKVIREDVKDAMEDIDPTSNADDEEIDGYVLDPEMKNNLVNNIQGDEDLEDVIDVIRFKVSRATEDFIQKNIVDKLNIKDIMYTTKEKLDAVKNGDDVLDDEITQEHTMIAKRAIKEVSKRPHSIFEQMVINLTEQVISNEDIRKVFTLESGKLDMDKIVKRATSYYTFLEMANTLNLINVNEEYIQEAIAMK